MPGASRTEILNCSKEQLRKAILDYEAYPDNIDGMETATIIAEKDNAKDVKFTVNIIKRFEYILRIVDDGDHIHWSMVEGDLFKTNNGEWNLVSQDDGKVEADYRLDLEFKMFVPGMVTKKLAGSNLPSMFKQFEKWAQRLS